MSIFFYWTQYINFVRDLPLNNSTMKNVFLTILSLMLSSCGVEVGDQKAVAEKVVLIFKDAPDQLKRPPSLMEPQSYGGVVRKGTIEYIDSLMDIAGFTPKSIGYDTTSIPTFNGFAEIYHAHRGGASSTYFLLKAGDTVLFTYDTITFRPQLQSLTSPENTVLYNIEQTTPGTYLPNGMKHLSTLTNLDYVLSNSYMHGSAKFLEQDGRDSIARRIYIDFDSIYAGFNRYARRYSQRLDSLSHTQPRYAQFYSDHLVEHSKTMGGYEKHYQTIKEFYKTGIRKKSAEPTKDNSSKDHFFATLSDTLLNRLKYRNSLDNVTQITYTTDLEAEYTRIDTSSTIPPITKDKMLATIYLTMQEGFFEYNALNSSSLEKYAKLRGDSITLNRITGEKVFSTVNCDLNVIDWQGKKINFLEVLKKYKGSEIYLDYWASWCAPCNNEMPASKKLKAANANNNIVFIYVAIWDEEANWRKKVKELGLDTEYCYFATNSKNSEYLQGLDVTSIPRYMLFNKKGEISNANAPRPSQNKKLK